ncbi:MAG: MgtC/SapB family protein [bacterium]|nr:MgtC/SapB family protein [bacterium]
MINIQLIQPFVIALVLGAFLGFERAFAFKAEVTEDSSGKEDLQGGVRTYSLISLLGCMASFLDKKYYSGILLAAFCGIILLICISYFVSFYKLNERGITTEISLIICFVIGAMVQKELYMPATFITIFVVVILFLKEYMNKLNQKVESEDIRAVIKFTIITFIILPLFDPNYALFIKDIPFAAAFESIHEVIIIKPYTVWLMVVLISGISFTGYIAIKILGSRKGIGLTGFLGGLVSSTATTLTFAKRSIRENALSLSFALAVLLACSTMFPRILVEVMIVNSALLPSLSITMGLMALTGFTVCLFIWKKTGNEQSEEVPLSNPFNIAPAVKFGLLYAVVVFLTRFVGTLAGDSGLYVVSILSGLTDVDAITLTMSEIAKDDPSKLPQATIAITLAAFSNTVLKAGMAFSLGSPKLKKITAIGFASIIGAGIAGLVILAVL